MTVQTLGTVILNSNQQTIEGIVGEVIDDFLNRGQMNREQKEKLKLVLLSQQRSYSAIAGTLTGRKPV